jgi:hypothetical protein
MTLRERLTEATGKPHLSYSSIKYALGDMRLWEMYMKGQLKKESDALVFGTLYDMLLFERDKAYDQYYVLNDDEIVAKIGGKYPRNTKKYKEWKAEAAEKNQGKTLVSSEDWKKAIPDSRNESEQYFSIADLNLPNDFFLDLVFRLPRFIKRSYRLSRIASKFILTKNPRNL